MSEKREIGIETEKRKGKKEKRTKNRGKRLGESLRKERVMGLKTSSGRKHLGVTHVDSMEAENGKCVEEIRRACHWRSQFYSIFKKNRFHGG